MSAYEQVFPDSTRLVRLLTLCAVLDVEPETFERLRDAWVELVEGDVVLAFYTRLGGGNRGDYHRAITALQQHPNYLSDRDDRADSTYATFRFRLPVESAEAFRPGLAAVLRFHAHPGEVDTDLRWFNAIAALGRGEITPTQTAGFDQLVTAIGRFMTSGDGPRIIEI